MSYHLMKWYINMNLLALDELCAVVYLCKWSSCSSHRW